MRWRPSRTPSDCREIKGQDTVNRFVIHIYGNGKQLFLAVANSCISYDILNPNGCTQKNEEPTFSCRLRHALLDAGQRDLGLAQRQSDRFQPVVALVELQDFVRADHAVIVGDDLELDLDTHARPNGCLGWRGQPIRRRRQEPSPSSHALTCSPGPRRTDYTGVRRQGLPNRAAAAGARPDRFRGKRDAPHSRFIGECRPDARRTSAMANPYDQPDNEHPHAGPVGHRRPVPAAAPAARGRERAVVAGDTAADRTDRATAHRGNPFRAIPVLRGILPLRAAQVPADVIAGVTLAALAVPEVMGYTKIAGTPVITGLYTILVPTVLFALFGSSRHLVVGADSATAAILASGLVGLAAPGSDAYVALAGVLAFIAAGFLLLARFLRLGVMADVLSRTVLVGFLTGVGIQVALGEIAGMLGLKGGGHGTLQKLWNTVQQIGDVNPYAVATTLSVLGVIVGSKRVS